LSWRQASSDFDGGYEPNVSSTIEQYMYVDNCPTFVPDIETGNKLVDDLRSLLARLDFV